MVLLQASSVGMPIVRPTWAGTAEVVTDEANGFVVPPKNHVALANAMTRVLKLTDAERARMADCGRQSTREKFDIERVLDLWESVYIEHIKIKLRTQSSDNNNY